MSRQGENILYAYFLNDLQKLILVKKSEDVVKDALSEMVVKYGRFTKETARNILI